MPSGAPNAETQRNSPNGLNVEPGSVSPNNQRRRRTKNHDLKQLEDRYEVVESISDGKARLRVVRIKGDSSRVKYVLKEIGPTEEYDSEIKVLERCLEKEDTDQFHVVELKESFGATDEGIRGIVIEPCAEMDLADFLEGSESVQARVSKYPWSQRPDDLKSFHGCLLDVMAYLTGIGIRHRDLKSRNILVKFGHDAATPDAVIPRVYICDFGLSRLREEDENDTTASFDHGTNRYKAPELDPQTTQANGHSEETDVWALGCVFLEIHMALQGWPLEFFVQQHGGQDLSYHSSLDQLAKWMEESPSGQSPQRDPQHEGVRKALIWEMLAAERKDRPSFGDLREKYCQNVALTAPCCRLSDSSDLDQNTSSSRLMWQPFSDAADNEEDEGFTKLLTAKPVSSVHLLHRAMGATQWQTGTQRRVCWPQNGTSSRTRQISLSEKILNKPWQTTQRLQCRNIPAMWMPLSFIATTQDLSSGEQPTIINIHWSDCRQERRRTGNNRLDETASTECYWEHHDDWDNWKISIKFYNWRDAIGFRDAILGLHEHQRQPEFCVADGALAQDQLHVYQEELALEAEGLATRKCYRSLASIREKHVHGMKQLDSRLIYVPQEVDMQPMRAAEEHNAQTVTTHMILRQLYEPAYVSNHPRTEENLDLNEISPQTPELRGGRSLSLHFSTPISHEARTSSSEHLLFLSRLSTGSWDCVLYCSFQSVSRQWHASLPRQETGVLMMWTPGPRHGMRFAFRFRKTHDFHYRWLVVQGPANKHQYTFKQPNRAALTFKSRECTEGDLFSLGKTPQAEHESGEVMKTNQDKYKYTITLEGEAQRNRIREVIEEYFPE